MIIKLEELQERLRKLPKEEQERLLNMPGVREILEDVRLFGRVDIPPVGKPIVRGNLVVEDENETDKSL